MDSYIATIILWSANFAPRGWAFCHGQTLNVMDNVPLFSLIGDLYGGDGRTTFALPDFRGRIPVGTGTGPGLSSYSLATTGGVENVTLGVNHLPEYTHFSTGLSVTIKADSNGSTSAIPSASANALGRISAPGLSGVSLYNNLTPDVALSKGEITGSTDTAGGSTSHENRQPYTALHYVISLAGIMPPRS